MNMAPFQFPDPSVQTTVTHPGTGETWIYQDGAWIVEEPSPTPSPTPSSSSGTTTNAQLQAEIYHLRSEIASLQTDIIGLRAQLTAATQNNFLILE